MNRALVFFLFLFATGILFGQGNALATSVEKGAQIYRKNCAVCHSKKGTGRGHRIPPLAQSDYLMKNSVASIKAIKYGMEEKITVNGVVYDKVMTAVDLNDREVADVMNYIMNAWGNRSDILITEDTVSAIQKY